MLADLIPLMDETVHQWCSGERDIHGRRSAPTRTTVHQARVVRLAGIVPFPASQENGVQYRATLWLIEHGRTVAIGDRISIPDKDPDAPYEVVGLERRSADGSTLLKAYLK